MFSWLNSQFSWLKISLAFFFPMAKVAARLAGRASAGELPVPLPAAVLVQVVRGPRAGPSFAAPTRRMWGTWRPDGI